MSNTSHALSQASAAGVQSRLLEDFRTKETARFVAERPRSRSALDAGAAPWLNGVPMNWPEAASFDTFTLKAQIIV